MGGRLLGRGAGALPSAAAALGALLATQSIVPLAGGVRLPFTGALQ